MENKIKHDDGITARIEQIWNTEGYKLLSIIPNVDYFNGSKDTTGELDILKLYYNGTIGIEEIKCTDSGYNEAKAKDQLKRARFYFQNYNPTIASYFLDSKRLTKYDVYMEPVTERRKGGKQW